MLNLRQDKKIPTPTDGAAMPTPAPQRPATEEIAAPSAPTNVQPEKSNPGYSAQLSTWLQHFDPQQGSQPLVQDTQTPSEKVGMSDTAFASEQENSVWQPGKDTFDWMKEVYGDPEEEAARERRNRTILGITAVGDALRHFGNIYHTTKGAPAQALSNATKEEADRQAKETALLQAQRQKTNEMLLKHQKMEADRLYREQETQRKNYETALKEKAYEQQAKNYESIREDREARRAQAEKQLEQKKLMDAHKVEMDRKNFQLRTQTQAENARHHRATEAHQAAMRSLSAQRLKIAASKGGGKVGTSGNRTTYLTGGKQCITMPKGALNATNTRHIFNKVMDGVSPEERIRLRGLKTDPERVEAIMQNTHIPGVAEDLVALGAEGLADLSEEKAPNGVDPSFWLKLRQSIKDPEGQSLDYLNSKALEYLDSNSDIDFDDSFWE